MSLNAFLSLWKKETYNVRCYYQKIKVVFMEFTEAWEFIKSESIERLTYRNIEGVIVYAPAVDVVLSEALKDFDEKIYAAYVEKGKFRADFLELRDNKKKVDEFSREDLQLFLAIQQKAEAIMGGQIAIILNNKIFIKVAQAILSL